MTSIPEAHTSSEVVKVTLSDHFLITTTVATNMQNDTEETVCTKRDYTNFNIEQLLQDISHCFHNFSVSDLNISVENYWLLWKKLISVENYWLLWKKLFNDICEQHAPLYHYKVRPKGRPWINKNIINMMRERDRVHRYANRRKDPIMLTLYKAVAKPM